MSISPYSNELYTVGWICALEEELVAARAMLDEKHGYPQTIPNADNNTYVLGSIKQHRVAISCLPRDEQGHISATRVATDMVHAFPQIRFGLMVGIGGGIPHYDDDDDDGKVRDIRLGDVVIGSNSQNGGIVRYDFGKRMGDGSFKETYALNRPPRLLSAATSTLQMDQAVEGSTITKVVEEMLGKHPHLRHCGYGRPSSSTDRLFRSDFRHVLKGKGCSQCGEAGEIDRSRFQRTDLEPDVHFGVIASGSEVVRHAPTRDEIKRKHDAICLEMEAAGLMNTFPCLVIRGISDYADSHKNDLWKKYAATTAAAYAKMLLGVIPEQAVQQERRVKEVLGEVHNAILAVDHKVSQLKLIAMKDQDAKVRYWLSPHNFSTELQDILREKGRGTGGWFWNSDEVQAWFGEARQTLLCPGIPGAGKTVMAATVVDRLQAIARQRGNPGVGVCYLFCNYQPKYPQKVEDLMRVLLKQLVSGQTKVPTHIQQLYDDHANNGLRPDPHRISQALIQTAQMYEQVYLVIDALDELHGADYEEYGRLLAEIFDFQQNAPVNILITSRFDTRITPPFQGVKQKEIRAHRDDLLIYVSEEMTRFRVKVDDNLGLQERIRASVLTAADGMFLLAKLHISDLRNKVNIGQLKKTLLSLPHGRPGLTETYHRAMLVIDSQSAGLQELARQALSWVAYSRKALSSDELRHALATQPGTTALDQDYLSAIDLIESSCGGLVVWDKGTDIVRLVHHTFQEYLHSQQSLPHAERDITITCISYLSFQSFSIGRCSNNDELKMRLRDNPLFNYCAKHWGPHAASSPSPPASLWVTEFLEKAENVTAAAQAMMCPTLEPNFGLLEADYISMIPCGISAVHIAAHFGLTEMLKTLIGSGAAVDTIDSMGRSPLLYATAEKQWPTALFLIEEAGANPRLADAKGHSVIKYAASAGNTSFVEHLLAKNVDADPDQLYSSSALALSTRSGNVPLMRLLINHGADIDRCYYDEVGGREMTLLELAVKHDHCDAVRALLENGCTPEDLPDEGGGLLCDASGHGNVEIVETLLGAGISPNLESFEETPLTAAIRGGHRDVISLILENQADVNAEDPDGFTPLMLAVQKQDDRTAAILTESGAQVNWYLTSAVEAGSETLIRLLLDYGADPNLTFESIDQTALGMAAKLGHISIAELLLENGANPDLKDQSLENALFPAAREGHDALLALLLDRGATPDTKNIVGNTALFYAVRASSETAIRLLLESGNDVNQRNELLETPLFLAARAGNLMAVKFLLDHGAEPDPQNLLGETPFLQAARNLGSENPSKNSIALLRVLLEQGSNPDPPRNSNCPDWLLQLLSSGSRSLDDRVNGLWRKSQAKINEARNLWSARVRSLSDNQFLVFADRLDEEKISLSYSSYLDSTREAWLRGREGPLTWAIRADCPEIIKYFTGYDADFEMAHLYGERAFTLAAARGHVKLVQMFLKHGIEERSLLVALPRAAENGHTEVIELLLTVCGQSRSPRWYTSGSSAVWNAADRGHTNTVRYLLNQGFYLERPQEMNSAVMAATIQGNYELVDLLLSMGVHPDVRGHLSKTPLCRASHLGYLAVARTLIHRGAHLESVDGESRTPLFYAVNNGHDSMVRFLLDCGANPDPEDCDGERPILWASGRGYETILRMLLQKNVSVQSRCEESKSPIFWALKRVTRDQDLTKPNTITLARVAEAHTGDYNAVLGLLLGHGAEVNIRDETGATPLSIALERGYDASVKLLLQYGAK